MFYLKKKNLAKGEKKKEEKIREGEKERVKMLTVLQYTSMPYA